MEFSLRELDFRYADEDDAEDIAVLINRSSRSEIEGNESFRKDEMKITAEEIETNCSSSSTRWIVLETPRPEELVVAAARLIITQREKKPCVIVDIFGTAESNAIRNILILRIEAICRSQGWNHIIFEVPSWSETFQNWLVSCGYQDLGGRIWPDDKQDMLVKPTMILEYQKNVNNELSSASHVQEDIQHDIESDELDQLEIIGEGAEFANDAMKGLITDLFRALHAENIEQG